jgi:hypothetical protein
MGRTRRTSNVIEKATIRLNNLKSVSPTLDLGPGLNIIAFEQLIGNAQTALDDYNQAIAALDEKGNQLAAREKQTGEMSTRMLAGVGARHGKNSDEYEKAGGVRTDEIKRAARKTKKE